MRIGNFSAGGKNRTFFFDAGQAVSYHAPEWVPPLPKTDAEFGRVIKGNDWVQVADVTDNFMRKNTVSFETLTAEKIRITVRETWGDSSARIMEVRAALEN